MTTSIHIEPTSGVAVVACTGVYRRRDAQEAASALRQNAEWSGDTAVWDFRESTFDVSAEDVRALSSFILANQPEKPPRKMAFVAPRDVDFGLARMFEVYREDDRTELGLAREYEEALEWATRLR